MPVTFVIGRAGSGKTTRALDQICDAVRTAPLGRPIWLIVPRQATFEYQRELVERLGAFTRVRIAGMESLGDEVLAEVGGMATPHIAPLGRRMIVGRLLFEHHRELSYFASSARRPGLAGSIDALFDDFERSGRPLDQIDDVVGKLEHPAGLPGSPSLGSKLADLQLLYRAYQAYVGRDRLDPQKRRDKVVRQIARSELLQGATVYVDAFYEFTENERQILKAIAGVSADMIIHFTLPPESKVAADCFTPPDELSPFYRTELALHQLYALFPNAAIVRLTSQHRFKSPLLARLEAVWPDATLPDDQKLPPPASVSESESAVVFLEAADPPLEVQAVARRIRDLLAVGYRQRDVLVLSRSLDAYQHLIHAAFAEHDLTYFADRRRPASHHPVIRMLREMVRVARDGWSSNAILALAKTGLVGITPEECDRLENFVIEQGVNADDWLRESDWAPAMPLPAADETLDDASTAIQTAAAGEAERSPNEIRQGLRDGLRALAGRLGRSAPSALLRSLAAEVVEALERFKVRTHLDAWMTRAEAAGDQDQAGEHEAVWNQLTELLDQMVEVLGDEMVEPAEFVEVLESGLDAFDLAMTPATLDQVLVGDVDRTRSLTARAVFVLGLNRGSFPLTHREDSLLSNAERRALRAQSVDVDADAHREQLDERFLAYAAFTRGSERLYVSRPRANLSGSQQKPSEYWLTLRGMLPEAPVVQVEPCTGKSPDCLSTPRDLVASLLDFGRSLAVKSAVTDHPPAPTDWRLPLYNWVASRTPDGSRLDALLDRAWPALAYTNTASLMQANAESLFPSPLIASATQIESFAACPFQHFVTYGLRLSARGGGDISALDLNGIFHQTLSVVVQQAMTKKTRFSEQPHDELMKLVQQNVPAIAEQLRGPKLIEKARSQYLLARVERTLNLVLGTLREFLDQGQWKPVRVSVPFGPTEKLPSPNVSVQGGKVVQLVGRIDRLDLSPAGTVAIHDYRLGDERIVIEDIIHGLSLRLLVCALVLERNGNTPAGKRLVPAAVLAAKLLRSFQRVPHPNEAKDPKSREFLLLTKPRGLFRESSFETFDPKTTGGWSPVLQAFKSKDGTWGNRSRSDIAPDDEFGLLIDYVELKIAELAEQIFAGRIDVAPYWYEESSPCPRCDYRAICRFEQGSQPYRPLASLNREEAIQAMRAELAVEAKA